MITKYPQLAVEDMCAAIASSAEMARERYFELPMMMPV